MAITETSKLTERVVFFEKDYEKGTQQQPKEIYIQKYRCWCDVKQKFLKDILNKNGDGELEDKTVIAIRQPRKEFIKNSWIAKIGNQSYEITDINPDKTNKEWLTIVLKEVSL